VEAQQSLPGLRQSLGLTEPLPVILYASKLMKRKNPLLLFEAYRQLSRDQISPPAAYLLYVGDGEERPAIEQRIHELGWSSHVKVLGFKNQTELPRYFVLCDLFVLPSQREPFGLVINEAMNAGKAIISTNEVGASRDLVHEGRNGFVVPAGDVIALSQALSAALSDRARLRQMGDASQSIIAKWSFQQDIDGIMQALERVRRRS
jgi:glycosyltransferase involved in cell wall biosynthesis